MSKHEQGHSLHPPARLNGGNSCKSLDLGEMCRLAVCLCEKDVHGMESSPKSGQGGSERMRLGQDTRN